MLVCEDQRGVEYSPETGPRKGQFFYCEEIEMADRPIPPLTAPVVVDTKLIFPEPNLYTERHPQSIICNDSHGRLCLLNVNPHMKRHWELV